MIGLLNGSPKAPKGTSGAIINQLQSELGEKSALFSAQNAYKETYEQLDRCKKM